MNTKSLATTNNSPAILLINEFIYSRRLLEKVTKVTEVTGISVGWKEDLADDVQINTTY